MFFITPAPIFRTLATYLPNDPLQDYDRTIHICGHESEPHKLIMTATDKNSAFEWTLDYQGAAPGYHPAEGFAGLDILLNYPRLANKIKKGLFEIETDTGTDVPAMEHVDGNTRTRLEVVRDRSTLPRAVHTDIFPRIFGGLKPLAPGLAIPIGRCALDWKDLGFTKEFDPPAYMRFAGTNQGAIAFKVPRIIFGTAGIKATARIITMQYVTGDAPDGTED